MTFLGGNTAGANAATINVDWPAGIQAGDVAILVWTWQNTLTNTLPTGFTQRGSVDGGSGSLRSEVYRKVCDGTEAGAVALACSGANRQSAVLVAYRGYDTAAPIEAIASFAETVAGTTHAAPSVTTVSAGDTILTAYSERSTTGTNDAVPGSGYVERADTQALSTGAGGTITAVAEESPFVNHAAGASVTPPAWSSGNAFSTANVVTWTIALKAKVNVAPTASAGADQTVATGTQVHLDGTDSDSDGTIASRQWSFVSGPANPAISGATTQHATVTPTVAGTYVYRYVVTDNNGASSPPDDVTITVLAPPVLTYTKTALVEIDADTTSGTLTLTQTSGPTATITGPDGAGVFRVVPPDPLTADITLQLTAANAGGTASQTVTIPAPIPDRGRKVRVGGVYV